MIEELENMSDQSIADSFEDIDIKHNLVERLKRYGLNDLETSMICGAYLGLESDDIALILRVKESAARSALSRGQAKMRKYFDCSQ